jgi:hypothetical protein
VSALFERLGDKRQLFLPASEVDRELVNGRIIEQSLQAFEGRQ